jgi:hypothetical protein
MTYAMEIIVSTFDDNDDDLCDESRLPHFGQGTIKLSPKSPCIKQA